jgi:hypothetical protein
MGRISTGYELSGKPLNGKRYTAERVLFRNVKWPTL